MTIQIIYAKIFYNVLMKIPGHIVDGWLCDLKGSLVFKIQAKIVYPAEFHLQTLHLQWLELYSLFPWLFHPFRLLQKSCCLSKFQEESFWEDIPSVKGPVDQSSPLCKYRRCCVYCLYSNWVQDILFANNLISGKWMPKNVQITIQLHSFHMLARLCSKSFKLGFSSMWTKNFRCTSQV